MLEESKRSSEDTKSLGTEVSLDGTSKPVNLIYRAVMEELEGEISVNESLRHVGIASIPDGHKDQVKGFIEALLRQTSQGAPLVGETVRLVPMKPELADNMPATTYVSGRTVEYRLSDKVATFEIGIGVDIDTGRWETYYEPDLPTDRRPISAKQGTGHIIELSGERATEIRCVASMSETVDLIHSSMTDELERAISDHAALPYRGITCIPEDTRAQVKQYIEHLLRFTSQGASLDGVTVRLEAMEPYLEEDEDSPTGFHATGTTFTYMLSGKECTFDIGVGVDPDGRWTACYDPDLPDEYWETVVPAEQDRNEAIASHCCAGGRVTAPEESSEGGDKLPPSPSGSTAV